MPAHTDVTRIREKFKLKFAYSSRGCVLEYFFFFALQFFAKINIVFARREGDVGQIQVYTTV